MAVLDLTGLKPPFATKKVDLPGGVSIVRQVKLPKWCRRVSGRWEINSGQYSHIAGDNVLIDDDHQTVPANSLHSLNLSRSGRAGDDEETDISLASPVGATVVRLTLEVGAS